MQRQQAGTGGQAPAEVWKSLLPGSVTCYSSSQLEMPFGNTARSQEPVQLCTPSCTFLFTLSTQHHILLLREYCSHR